MGDGYGHGVSDNGYEFGISVEGMSLDANNIAGVVPLLNWYAGQHSFADHLNLFNFTGLGFDIEGPYAENSTLYGYPFRPRKLCRDGGEELYDSPKRQ